MKAIYELIKKWEGVMQECGRTEVAMMDMELDNIKKEKGRQ
jgi:hypothetical protein